jgi:hypothetical protein
MSVANRFGCRTANTAKVFLKLRLHRLEPGPPALLQSVLGENGMINQPFRSRSTAGWNDRPSSQKAGHERISRKFTPGNFFLAARRSAQDAGK